MEVQILVSAILLAIMMKMDKIAFSRLDAIIVAINVLHPVIGKVALLAQIIPSHIAKEDLILIVLAKLVFMIVDLKYANCRINAIIVVRHVPQIIQLLIV